MHKELNRIVSRRRPIVTAAAVVALFASAVISHGAGAPGTVQIDPNLPDYKSVQGISGSLNSVGSDSMNNLMTLWGEGFAKYYPNVKIQVEGKGSSTAPAALIAGTAQLGPMSRPMKEEEIDKFEKKFGYKPAEYRTSIDALAVYVNKDNPIKEMTMEQVDAVFSSTRLGGNSDITRWGQLGLTGEWANRPVSLYGRNSASGTYGFFKEVALFKGDYKSSVKEQPGSAAVVQGVTEDIGGIGYSGIGYRTSGVKMVPLSKKQPQSALKRATQKLVFYEPSYENALKGNYPLSRFMYVYINQKPNEPLDPLVREFMRFIFTKEGQEVVVKDGYDPLTAKMAEEELAKLK